MKTLAARVAAEGESYATSMFLWKDVYDSTTDPLVKKNALQHLRLLQVKEDCRRLDVLADEYVKRHGKRPATIRELVQEGLLAAIPVDPEGFAYDFGADGKAELNLNSPLLEEQLMHEHFK
jgi:hypothetical protein